METVAQDTADLHDATDARQSKGMTRTSCDHRRWGGPSSDPARIIEINWQTEALQMAPTRTTRGVCLCFARLPSQYLITFPGYFADISLRAEVFGAARLVALLRITVTHLARHRGGRTRPFGRHSCRDAHRLPAASFELAR